MVPCDSHGTIRIVHISFMKMCGPGSSVGIATELRAGRSGIESRCGRDFLPVQTGPGVHPASCKMDTGSFPGVKCGRGVLLTTHPLGYTGPVTGSLYISSEIISAGTLRELHNSR